jgi:hypothetical protein
MLLACIVAMSGVVRAGGTDEGMSFLDIRQVDRSQLELRALSAQRALAASVLPIRTSDRAIPASSSFGDTVLRLDMHASSLVPFHSGVLRRSASDTVMRLPFGRETYELAIVDATFDETYDVYHVAAVMLGASDGYARFTVDVESGAVIGSVYTDAGVWRLTPSNDGHLVRPVKVSTDDRARPDLNTVHGPGISRLEDRHVQMLRIAEISPRRFHTTATGALVAIMGGDIEHIDLTGVLAPALDVNGRPVIDEKLLTAELNAALNRMRPLTQSQKNAEIAIQSVTIDAAGRELVVRVNEIVEGVPVEPSGLFTVNARSGEVNGFAMLLVAPDVQVPNRDRWLDRETAAILAQQAIATRYEGPLLLRPQASVRFVAQSEEAVTPEWVISFDEGLTSYIVIVDAITGETRIQAALDNAGSYYQTICNASGQTVYSCSSSTTSGYGVWKVSDVFNRPGVPEGNFRCYNPAIPCDPRHIAAAIGVEEMEDFVQSAGGQPDWGRVDVVADMPTQEIPAYDYITHSVVLPPVGQGGYLTGVDPLSAAARQVLYHELMHHHQRVTGGPSYTDGSTMIQALREGLADAGAAIKTDDWALYDGILVPEHHRDLRVPRSINDFNNLPTNHQKGMVFGNMIYRLSSKANVSTQALANLALETFRKMSTSYSGNPAAYELSDVHAAMLEAAANNPYLTQALYEVWVEMDGTPSQQSGVDGPSGGIPPSPGTPAPPPYVEGYFKFCNPNNPGWAVHQNNWMGILGASSYQIYYSANHGGTWNYSFTSSGTTEETTNSQPVRVAVKSCNFVGCSWLSNDYYFQDDIC